MQITLNQDEIEVAIRAYVTSQIAVASGHDINIELKAGRGDNGFSATLDIAPAKVETKATTTPIRRTPPKAVPATESKPAPKEEVEEEVASEQEQEPDAVGEAEEGPEVRSDADADEVDEVDDEVAPPARPKTIFGKKTA